jgi:hypothetical protein
MIYSDPIYRFNIAKQRPLLFKKFQNHNFIFSGDKGPTGDQGIYTVALWGEMGIKCLDRSVISVVAIGAIFL